MGVSAVRSLAMLALAILSGCAKPLPLWSGSGCLSMDEILKQLRQRAKVESEEGQRLLVAAENAVVPVVAGARVLGTVALLVAAESAVVPVLVAAE